MRNAKGYLTGGTLAVAAVLAMTGCGTSPANGGAGAADSGRVAVLPMPTSGASTDGTSWAAVLMGGSAAQHNNFWELFARPAGGSTWKLVTPLGVASNGGIAAAATGPQSLAAAVLPSQDLTFSPLATSTDGGTHWSQAAPVSPGMATTPDTLAAGPAGKLLALTSAGVVQTGTGSSWTPLTSEKALARTAAGRACGLAALTATGWTAAGAPLVAGICAKPGRVGVFELAGGSWQAAGPTMPASVTRGPVEVLGMQTAGTKITAMLAVRTGSADGLIAAWTADNGQHWALSPVLRTGPGTTRSVSIWQDGSAGVVLSGGRGETIGWQATAWRSLPSLPAHSETLALGSSGQVDALSADAGTLTAWQLPAGATTWALTQTTHVQIPYGSSS